jgi:Cu2+-exporting ATPase
VSDSAAVSAKRQQKLDKLQKTTHDLAVAWGLSLLCGLGHLGHVWAGAPAWMHALHHPVLGATLSAAALLGESKAAAGKRIAKQSKSHVLVGLC